MSQVLKHLKVSGIADGPDPTQVNPSDWNAAHVFSGGALGGLLVRDTGDATYGASWLASVAAGSVLISNGVGALPTWASSLTLGGSLTIGGIFSATVLGPHGFSASGVGGNTLSVYNSTAGTGNYAAVYVGSDTSASLLSFIALSSIFSGSSDAAAGGGLIRANGVGGLVLSATHATGLLRLFTNSLERLRIDQNGVFTLFGPGGVNVAGTMSVGTPGTAQFNVRNAQNSTTGRTDVNIGNDANASLLDIATYASGYTATGGFDLPSSTLFYHSGAGGMAFYTQSGAATISFWTAGVRRWTIDPNNGDWTTGNTAFGSVHVVVRQGLIQIGNAGTVAATALNFVNANGGVGSVQTSGNVTAYLTSSDARLKIDDGPATNLDALRAVAVRDFRWKVDDRSDRGVFAQDAAATFPRAIRAGSDDLTDGGDLASPWMTDYSKFVPDLIAGWQQHEATIAHLRAELAALKG